ncbi:hypothetical protein BO86DRAFT_383775 [Aspergillus japonicus CBS 114.51]|uniref:Uncharacterized protein n=1 Tax=Aspergillus japonicus CBS 114.51 TaxID=1448312 RepID=A0A8T8WL81_ASPJA|nr:hypothetical protein BO86DRAFT_383775 [Aspergillus japonicus CBS 114.51]RAH76527.1 hypothetical protein BO86DRAFT_383775 [Aspergillus japonicus CBS 114.51]
MNPGSPVAVATEAPATGIFEECRYTVTRELFLGGDGVDLVIETLRLNHEDIADAANWHTLAERLLRARWDEYPLFNGEAHRRAAVVIHRDRVRMFVDDRPCHPVRPFIYRDEIEWYSEAPYGPVRQALFRALWVPTGPILLREDAPLGQQLG